MAQQNNPFDQFDAPANGLPPGARVLMPIAPQVQAKDATDLANARLSGQRTAIQNAQDTALFEAQRRKAYAEAANAEGQNRTRRGNMAFDRAGKLRNDYLSLPSVKSYTQALPVYAAGLRSKPDAAGDLNLIYAYAKVMDPNSVVREREQASVAGGDTWINQKVAGLQKQLGQGGTFKPEFRKRLREEMAGRMTELDRQFIADRVNFKQNAQRNGVDPLDVVGEHPGARFQPLEEQVLGRKAPALDFAGNVVATGATRTERDPKASKLVDSLIRSGGSVDQANAALSAMGLAPVNAQQFAAAQAHYRANPTYKGSYGDITREVQQTALNRASSSAPVAGFVGALNGASGGFLDEGVGAIDSALTGKPLSQAIREADASKQAIASNSPKSSFVGNLVGSYGIALAGGAGAARLGLTSLLGKTAPYVGSAAYGAFSGACDNNDNRLLGAGIGGIAGAAGYGLGELASIPVGAAVRSRPVQATIGQTRRMFGGSMPPPPSALTPAEAAYANAAAKADPAAITQRLSDAAELGVPMSPADAHPELRELAGAAVRRSPTASAYAENTLIPRSRGQIDRFGQAVNRDLGPAVNIPRMSDDLTRQARAAAAPLYDRAYQQPIPSTPELESLLNTPFGREGIAKARTIAANERRSPTELGFAQDANGNVVLNPQPNDAVARHLFARQELDAAQEAYRAAKSQPGSMDAARTRLEQARQGVRQAEALLARAPDPSVAASVPTYTTQTLDYAKRGMDDVLEQYRNPITNRLDLSEAGRAQNGVKNQLLGEMDRLNPVYGQARQTYQGPVASRDALMRGQDAYNLAPDVLEQQIAGQTPEHLAQMQLGYRDSLMGAANKVRYSSNPFEATLGTPVAEQRLGLLHPGNENIPRLLRTRDMERDLAQSTSAILGNSKTAQRQIADKAFDGEGLGHLVDVGVNLATGQVPTGVLIKGLTGQSVKDAYKFGVGKRAVAKADDLAPMLLNPDPAAGQIALNDLLTRANQYQEYVAATRPTRSLGMFGRGLATVGAAQYGR